MTMNTFLRVPALLAALLILSAASTSLVAQPVVNDTAEAVRVRLDVKTKLIEKFGLSPIKNGAILLLDESDWAATTELGEDYALWVRNAERVEGPDSIIVTFELELREPATFGEGTLLAARTVRLAYPPGENWKEYAPAAAEELIADVERYAGYGLDAVRVFATPLTSFAVRRVLEFVEQELPGGTLDAAKLEAMIAGARIAYETRGMVEEARRASSTTTAGRPNGTTVAE